MNGDGDPGGPGPHPLRGVLDRLLTRERGGPSPEGHGVAAAHAPLREARMLPLAGLEGPGGCEVLRTAAELSLALDRSPAIVDLASAETPGESGGGNESRNRSIPMAVIPCPLEQLQAEPAEIVGAVLERLRRMEAAADLLLVRIPARYPRVLLHAAFLAGGLVLPQDGGDRALDQAFRIARDVVESFRDLRIWPLALRPGASERFLGISRDFLGIETTDLGDLGEGAGECFRSLIPPPEEGFTAALLSTGTGAPPPHLLKVGTLTL